MIELNIYGDPKAQQRHRHTTIQPKDPRRKSFVSTYDPDANFKKNLLLKVQNNAPLRPFDEALRVDLIFTMTRPQAHYGSGKNSNVLKPSAPEYHLTKPDIDNLRKLIMDALSGVFWRDDKIIVAGYTFKTYGDRPTTNIKIYTMNELYKTEDVLF